MMTSRSEYRLLLRQDNADERLTPIGYRVGLISEKRYNKLLKKLEMIQTEMDRISQTTVSPSEANPILEKYNSAPLKTGIKLSELLKRPELDYESLKNADRNRPDLPDEIWEEAEIKIKYEGYIKRQLSQAEQAQKMESRLIPEDTDYDSIYGLRLEARQKLKKIRPHSLGQASRISGVSPADISVLIIWLQSRKN